MYFKRTKALTTGALTALLCGSLAAAPALAPIVAYAETSEDLQAQLDAARARLDELQKNVDQSTAELGKTQYDLEQTQQRITEVEAEIAENEEKLAEAQQVLGEHISSSYKHNDIDILSLVLQSDSFSTLISRVYYANKVAVDEAEAISTVQDLQASLESSKQELQQQEEEQKQLVSARETETSAAEAAAAEQQSYISQLSDEVREKLEEERIAAAQAALEEAQAAIAAENEQNSDGGSADDGSQDATDNGGNENAGSNSDASDDDGSDADPPTAPSGGSSTGSNDGSGSGSNGGSGSDSGSNQGGGSTGGSNGGSGSTPSTGGGSTATSSQCQTAVDAALSQVGKPYGHSNDGTNWDCNGLTHWAWAQAGVSIPISSGHYSYGQFQWMKNSGRWVTSVSQLKPGDLVFYSYDGGVTTYHVAMYIGAGQVVHANGYNWGVHTSSIYFDSGFCGGGSPI